MCCNAISAEEFWPIKLVLALTDICDGFLVGASLLHFSTCGQFIASNIIIVLLLLYVANISIADAFEVSFDSHSIYQTRTVFLSPLLITQFSTVAGMAVDIVVAVCTYI
ncbi:hypothetical protein L596_009903 [Steinernema carpocapsae]|uniref:Uncharacterized protein n=1 Tax=Steinernema carpocapsae TaxID=34508 RepID=A0A4U5PGN8_STECR|nr:hypothetical protein L596_009903 [Steinernema carpocapsae]